MYLDDRSLLTALALRTFAFEGINGVGKSTTIAAVAQRLIDANFRVSVFRDPGSHPVAQELRLILKNPAHKLDGMSATLLFSAARRLLLEEIATMFVEDPKRIFLLDRWVWSTLAYQCANGVPWSTVMHLYEEFSPLPLVNGITGFHLFLEPSLALARTRTALGQDVQEDRFEAQGLAYMRDVSLRYAGMSLREVPTNVPVESVACTCADYITLNAR